MTESTDRSPSIPAAGNAGRDPRALRAAWSAFFAALFLSLTFSIEEPDFWWHLASGKWMWENHSLLRTDPFSLPSEPGGAAPGAGVILKQYWLAQLIQYGVYALGGFKALVLLRAAVYTLMFVLLRGLLVGTGAGHLVCSALLVVSTLVVTREIPYINDRPQMWSSLFAVALIGVLEALRRGHRWSRWALPLLMLVWSNLHGGFLYGDALIGALMLGALLTRSGHPAFYLVGALSILVSGLNPLGFTAVSYLLPFLPAGGPLESPSNIAELQSIFGHVRSLTAIPRSFPFLSVLLLASAGSWLLLLGRRVPARRLDLLLPYLLATAMGVRAIRFLIIFVPVAAVVTAVNAAAGLGTGRAGRPPRVRRAGSWGALGVLVLAVCWLTPAGIRATVFGRAPAYRAPAEGAAAFVKSAGLAGNVFNEYNLGGYLIWALWPANRVFIDGRALSPSAYASYKITVDQPERPASTSREGRPVPAYRELFAAQRIDLVITPGCDPPTGRLIALPVTLLRDPEWAPVYADRETLVFARMTPRNVALIGRLRLPPAAVADHLEALAAASAGDPHGGRLPYWRYTIAYAYYLRGDTQRALAYLDEYLALAPRDEVARQVRGALQQRPRP